MGIHSPILPLPLVMNDDRIAGVDVKVSNKLYQVPSPGLADYQVFNLFDISMTIEIIDAKNGDIIWSSEIYFIEKLYPGTFRPGLIEENVPRYKENFITYTREFLKDLLENGWNFYEERRRNQIFVNLDFTFICGII